MIMETRYNMKEPLNDLKSNTYRTVKTTKCNSACSVNLTK